MEDKQDLVVLASQLEDAKYHEAKWKEERIAAEDAIIKATGFVKPEGRQAFRKETKAGTCWLVLNQPISSNVDSDAWLKLRRALGIHHAGRDVFKQKFTLDKKAATALQSTNKRAWIDVSEVVTRKPGKVGIELKSLVLVEPSTLSEEPI